MNSMTQSSVLLYTTLAGLITLTFSGVLTWYLLKLPTGNDRMRDIANAIKTGANAYLIKQYKVLAVIAALLFFFLGYFINWITGLGFLLGAVASALSGYLGMAVAVRANVRTAEAAKTGLSAALGTAFRAGSITGLTVAAMALLSVSVFYWLTGELDALIGLAFGSSLISVFARLGGGIFTNGADFGAHLVGKI